MRTNRFFVTGVGTDVGKTVVSAMLVSALRADYWKPVQAGVEGGTDTQRILSLTAPFTPRVHRESYCLTEPMSPHAAAKRDNVQINPLSITLPQTSNALIVEGAGGLHVPLNYNYLVSDLLTALGLPVIVVSRNYLGSINHTLLTIEALHRRAIDIAGIVFNGTSNPDTEEFILSYTGVHLVGKIPEAPEVTPSFIEEHGARLVKGLRG